MNAGLELDALVAEKVFGVPQGPGRVHFQYSTHIAAAWLVVEKLRADGWLVTVKEMPDGFPFTGDDVEIHARACCECLDMNRLLGNAPKPFPFHSAFGLGDTAPLAICRAALQIAEWEERGGRP